MNKTKIALVHYPETSNYKLVKMTEMDVNDPSFMWAFDISKVKLAEKLAKNMNIANVLNQSDNMVMCA